MPFGHRGVNQPVRDTRTGEVRITSHNHGFAVDPDGVGTRSGRDRPDRVRPRGAEPPQPQRRHAGRPPLSRRPGVLGPVPPRGGTGPHDARGLFDDFRTLMEGRVGSSSEPASDSPPEKRARRPDAETDGPVDDHGDRFGTDRDRPGVRVRLLRHAGVQGAQAGGVSRRARQLEPGDDHDRPGVRRPDLHRAAHARIGARRDRAGTAGCAAADDRRSDRAERERRARRVGRPRASRRRADRREPGDDPPRRGSQWVQGDDDEGGSRRAASGNRAHPRGSSRARERSRVPGDRPAVVHAGRRRERVREPRRRNSPRSRGARSPRVRSRRSSSRSPSPAGRSSSSR